MQNEDNKNGAVLRNEKIIIKPVPEYVASWIPEGKDGRIAWEGSSYSSPAPLHQTHGLMTILSENEQAVLEQKIDPTKPKGWMSPYIQGPANVWMGKNKYKIEFGRMEGLELDLSNPMDYIKYAIARSLVEDFAPSYEQRLDKRYLFYMESQSNIERKVTDSIDKKVKIATFISERKNNAEALRNFLLVINNGQTDKIPITTDLETLLRLVVDYSETRPDMFISHLENPDYRYKVFYFKALERGVMTKKNSEILGMDGELIGYTFEDAYNYIKGLEADTANPDKWGIFQQRIKR